jgi:hypothetical protein
MAVFIGPVYLSSVERLYASHFGDYAGFLIVSSVRPQAAEYFEVGDAVLVVEGVVRPSLEEFRARVAASEDDVLTLEIARGRSSLTQMVPVVRQADGGGRLGVSFQQVTLQTYVAVLSISIFLLHLAATIARYWSPLVGVIEATLAPLMCIGFTVLYCMMFPMFIRQLQVSPSLWHLLYLFSVGCVTRVLYSSRGILWAWVRRIRER